MTEREMLEYAAKAAGVEGEYLERVPFDPEDCVRTWGIDRFSHIWNPLLDDGDAFRLAALLCLVVQHLPDRVPEATEVWRRRNDFEQFDPIYQIVEWDGNQLKAIRLAITRAAAEIGKQMGDV